jgi:ABC-2 type transport system permease protein
LPGVLSLEYAVLAVSVLGVLEFSSDFSTGLISTTFVAVPRRRVMPAAKAAVTGIVTLVAGEVVAFASFFCDQAVLHSHHRGVSVAHHGVLGAVLAGGVLLLVSATLGLALGAIIRHTADGIATVVALIALPAIFGLLPALLITRNDT